MFAAIPQAGNPLGIALSSGMFFFSANLDGDWKWRVPFLVSAVLVGAGLFVRAKLNESPEFEEAKATGATEKNPLLTALHRHLPAQPHQRPAPDVRSTALGAITTASILAIGVTFAAGTLTDRIGRRPIYVAGCVTAIAFGFPMYLLTEGGNPVLVVAVFVFGIGVIHASLTGAQGSLLTEQFRTSTRTSGASLGYQVAASLGGFAPLLAGITVGAIGWPGAALLREEDAQSPVARVL